MAYGQYESDNLERNKQLYKWCPTRRRRRRMRHDEGGKRFVQMTRRLLFFFSSSPLRAREQIYGSSRAAHTYIVRRAKVTVERERREEKEFILPRTEIPERVTQVCTHKGCSSPFLVVFQSAGAMCALAYINRKEGGERERENFRVRNVRITSQEIQLAKNQPSIDVRHRSRMPSRIRRKTGDNDSFASRALDR